MKIVVCDINNRECMVHRCSNCPGRHALNEFLSKELMDMEMRLLFSSNGRKQTALLYYRTIQASKNLLKIS